MGRLDTHDRLLERFEGITGFLRSQRVLWESRPFVVRALPWEDDFPQTATRLRSLSLDEIEAYEAGREDPGTLSAELKEWSTESTRWCAVPLAVPAIEAPAYDKKLPRRIRERKWSQIKAFASAAWPLIPDGGDHLVDWCAGKGHLGRILGHITGLPVTAIEQRGDLCESGRSEAALAGVTAQFLEGDVHDPRVWHHLKSKSVAVALHACGALTDRLLEQAQVREIHGLACAPCCYHALGGEQSYLPRSQSGKNADLPLSQHNLRLATTHEVVARPAVRVARRREMAWRLGLDLLLREGTGTDRYHPQGPFSRALLDLPFEAFCHQAAEKRSLPLPTAFSSEKMEEAGWERARIVRGLALVRGLFRRPLEIWLVLDRALGLAEEGRDVQVHRFCQENLSPRNLMLTARY